MQLIEFMKKPLDQTTLVYTNKRNLSFDELLTTKYFFIFPVMYLYLVALLDFSFDFSCILGVGVNYSSVFSLCTIF